MTLRRAVMTVFICVLISGEVGAAAGYLLGRFNPGYYRSTAPALRDANFDPVSFGVGMGLTQGLAGGVFAGLALVAILCWREVKLNRSKPAPPGTVRSNPEPRRLLWFAGTIVMFVLGAAAAFVIGTLVGESGAYHRQYLEERRLLEPGLSTQKFARVKIGERSDGGVYLSGTVSTPADLEHLLSFAAQTLGESRGRKVIGGVGVRPQP
jgi:hypothetical protein